jgi:predicted ferric reductase
MTQAVRAAARRRDTGRVAPRWAAGAVVLVVVALTTLLWFDARPWVTRTVNTPARLGAASSFAAVQGTVLLSLTILLSARHRFVEGVVGGLDRVYRIHHWLGAVAFALLAFHPSLLAWRYSQVSWRRAAHLWLPAASDLALTAGQFALWVLCAGMVVTVFLRVRHSVLLWTQRLLGAAFVPAAWHVLRVGGDVGNDPALRRFMFVVCAVGLAALVFHTVLGRWTMPQHRYRLVDIRPMPGGVDDLHLEPVGAPMTFRPGQFGFLRFRHETIGAEAHPFSIASPPTEATVRFVVKELGDYTRRLLREVHEGAEAIVEGPYGRFSHETVHGADQVWVAGGIGIAPFLSMAASLPGSGIRAELYYCFPDDDQAPFLAELAQLDASVPELTVRMRCDRRDGLLTAGVIAGHGALGDREFLLCGPPVMMHSMRRQLRRAGVPSGRIHFEEFVFG